MATIRKRGTRFQAIIRITGYPQKSKSFHLRKDAEKWARSIEAQMEAGTYQTQKPSDMLLSELLTRYRDKVTISKKGRLQETNRINRLLRDAITSCRLCDLSPAVLAKFRDRRIKDGVRACQYDLIIIRHAIATGRSEWGLHLPDDPFASLRVPNGVRKRVRRLEGEECRKLLEAAQRVSQPLLEPVLRWAMETGMRKSEILALTWEDIDWQRKLAQLRDTKNGEPRAVPLSHEAEAILQELGRSTEKVFPITVPALRCAWDRAIRLGGIEDLRFHDLRHEAISRLFEQGLSVPEVALISGHKTLAALQIYANMRPEAVGEKLRRLRQAA